MDETTVSVSNELLQANLILLHHQVLDAFGHVSVRHPQKNGRFLMSIALPPSQVKAEDIIEFNLDASPVDPTNQSLYIERFIHSSIYQARPEVMAICHHHAKALLPFCITSTSLQAVTQTGGAMGEKVAVWDSRDDFGDTNLLISNAKQADSLVTSLGQAWMILIRRHGVCVLGQNLRELVFRAVFACQDAEVQLRAAALGDIEALSAGELKLTSQPSVKAIDRCWQHWLEQIEAH